MDSRSRSYWLLTAVSAPLFQFRDYFNQQVVEPVCVYAALRKGGKGNAALALALAQENLPEPEEN